MWIKATVSGIDLISKVSKGKGELEGATDFLDLHWYFCGSQAISSPLKALVSGHILTRVKSSNNSEDNQGLVATLPYNKGNVQRGQAVAFDECQVFSWALQTTFKIKTTLLDFSAYSIPPG